MVGVRVKQLLRILLACALTVSAYGAAALDRADLVLRGGDAALRSKLVDASLLTGAPKPKTLTPREVLAAATADYGRLVRALYAEGYYSGTVHIFLDGREASKLSPFNLPGQFKQAVINVTPGPLFNFGQASITPVAPGSHVAIEFSPGRIAKSSSLKYAVDRAARAWREQGHAKVRLTSQRVTANHTTRTLDARITLDPGPRVTIGQLRIEGRSNVRHSAIRRISGLPSGQVFSPEKIKATANRLRHTGAFSTVTLKDAPNVNADGSLDIIAEVADQKPRRYGFGAEVSSFDGTQLSGFWLHRNLFGGAERFRFDAKISGFGGTTGLMDYLVKSRLEFPAVLGANTDAFLFAEGQLEEFGPYRSWHTDLGGGFVREIRPDLKAEIGIGWRYSDTQDGLGRRISKQMTFPAALTLDRRSDPLDPAGGYYVALKGMPFVGIDGSGNGIKLGGDLRGYKSFGDKGFVLAGRLQFGSVLGGQTTRLPADYLLYSGGGGSVRGFPSKSLGAGPAGAATVGGRGYLGASFEMRAPIGEQLGLVGFADAGYIDTSGTFDGTGHWHAGAGVGLRYKTSFGPIRFDVGVPVTGPGAKGVQLYVGIGQAF